MNLAGVRSWCREELRHISDDTRFTASPLLPLPHSRVVQGAPAFAPTDPDSAVHALLASELLPELSQRTRGGIRTPAFLIRSQALYPLSYTGIRTVVPEFTAPIMFHPLTVGQRQHILTPGVGVCRTGVSSNIYGASVTPTLHGTR